MNAQDLLSELKEHGVLVSLDGQNLRFKSVGPLLDRHRDALVRLKPEVVGLLSHDQAEQQDRVTPGLGLPNLRERLGDAGDLCATCDAPLSPGRLYQCEGCQERHPGGRLAGADSSQSEPHWGADGCLRIPFASDKRFHWWAGGQSPLATALELGATPDQAQRYADPIARRGIIRSAEVGRGAT